jgi:hypothetical protein
MRKAWKVWALCLAAPSIGFDEQTSLPLPSVVFLLS